MITTTLSTAFSGLLANVIPMPSPDPLGYPLPPILLQILSYFTLTLHFLAMNLTVGAIFIYIWLRIAKKPHDAGLAKYLGAILPLGVSYLITFGVPPLLFVQVMYGQMFYSSSILMGFHWILVIPLVIALYGIFYYQKLTKDPGRPRVLILSALGALALLLVGFFYVNNITLSMTPDKWLEMYQKSPGGHNLNLGDPTVLPRWLLMLVPGFAVAGVAIMFRGTMLLRWGLKDAGEHSHKVAMKVAILGMGLEVAAAAWMLAALPESIRAYVLGGGLPTILLASGVVLAMLGTVMILVGRNKPGLLFPILSSLLLFLALTPLVILRDLVRQEYLKPFFSLADVPVHHQWGMFGLFVAFLLAGLAFLIVMQILVVPKLINGRKAELLKT